MVANIIGSIKETVQPSRDFFTRKATIVAQALLSCILQKVDKGRFLIVETEAYTQDDPASHSVKGKTKRNQHMFLLGGHLYVYLIYGVHYCLNVVTAEEGVGEAVLIRSLLDLETNKLIPGPGRVCRHLQLNLAHSGLDIFDNNLITITQTNLKPKVQKSARIGITKGLDLQYRFYNEAILGSRWRN